MDGASEKQIDQLLCNYPSENDIEVVREWIKSNPDHLRTGDFCRQLLWKHYSQENGQVVRNWLEGHPKFRNAAFLFAMLVSLGKSNEDIVAAKKWLRENERSDIHIVVGALVEANDSESIEKTKWDLRNTPKTVSIGVATSLLVTLPNEEVFELVRNFLRIRKTIEAVPGPWFHCEEPHNENDCVDISDVNLLAGLLHHSPCKASLEVALELETVWKGSPIESWVLIELLNIDKQNEAVRMISAQWIGKISHHEDSDTVMELMA